MKFTTATVVLGAALGVAALPSHHAAHQHAHRSLAARDGHNFVYHAKPQPPAPKETKAAPKPKEEKPKAAPKKEKKPEPKPAPTLPKEKEPKKKQKPSGSSGKGTFCGGAQYNKRATLDEIHYAGNLGSSGNYGCNLKMIDAGDVDAYDHVSTFINASGKDQECKCWLKIGEDGGMTGFFTGGEALSFDLPAGEKAYMAADENTQGGCACGAGGVPLTGDGEFASTWYEYDMCNTSNGCWSGADASCIVSAAKGLNIPGMLVEGHGEKSIIYPGGTGKNAFLGGTEAMDGLGLNIAPGKKVRIDVTVGYSG